MRRESIRRAYKRGLIEPLARRTDRQEVEKQPYSRNTRGMKEWQAFVGRMLREARDRLFHADGYDDAYEWVFDDTNGMYRLMPADGHVSKFWTSTRWIEEPSVHVLENGERWTFLGFGADGNPRWEEVIDNAP